MSGDVFRVIAAALARIELRLARIEAEFSRRRENCYGAVTTGHADLLDALAGYFGGGTLTAGTVLRAAENNRSLQDVLAGLIDYNATPHSRAVQLGRLLRRLPGLIKVGGRRGAVMYRVRI